MMMRSISKTSSAAVVAVCVISGSARVVSASPLYSALHEALVNSSGFPQDAKAACMKTAFVSPDSWELGRACDASKPNPDTPLADLDCTPACTAYFVDNGPECELGEGAAKLAIIKAWENGTMSNADKQALFAWFTVVNDFILLNEPVEGVDADTIVQYLKDNKGDGGAVDEFLSSYLNESAMADYTSGGDQDYISRCVKDAKADSSAGTSADSSAGSSAASVPTTSAVAQGALISGVIGTVAYAFM